MKIKKREHHASESRCPANWISAFAGMATLLVLFSPFSWADPFLRIIQPYENTDLPYLEQSFVFGSVLPASAAVFVNGVRADVHSNGGFLVMVPFKEGRFQINALANDGVSITTVTRFVNVGKAPEKYEEDYERINPVSPTTRVVLRPGDLLSLSFYGAKNGEGSFRFQGRSQSLPMREERPGFYKTSYRVQDTDKFDGDDITFSLKRKDGKRISKRSGCQVIVQRRRTPRYVELKKDSILLTGPGSNFGYQMFFLKGVRLEVTGEMGGFLRVSLDNNNHGWIKKSAAEELPVGTPAARSVARNIRINVDGDVNSTILELPLEYIHPHQIDQLINPHRLSLTLYGVVPDTDRIRYKSPDTIIKEVLWKRYSPGSYTLEIETKQDISWGYDVRYNDKTLILEIRHKPKHNPTRTSPLNGLKIAIDAGHSKESFGTIGPWGNTEASISLMVAKVARRLFESKGAEVVMIQDGTREMSLQDRVDMAWAQKANMFLSIHADACGEAQNPRELEGYSVHYFQPQSRPLAEEIHREYGKNSTFRDQGLWRSNLAVCRITQMPSMLLEQGFLILPEFEEKMLTKEHHDMVAKVLMESIIKLMKKE